MIYTSEATGRFAPRIKPWFDLREASLSWIALGLLLAAWNAADDDAAGKRRPPCLRGYARVSVRAVHLESRVRHIDLRP